MNQIIWMSITRPSVDRRVVRMSSTWLGLGAVCTVVLMLLACSKAPAAAPEPSELAAEIIKRGLEKGWPDVREYVVDDFASYPDDVFDRALRSGVGPPQFFDVDGGWEDDAIAPSFAVARLRARPYVSLVFRRVAGKLLWDPGPSALERAHFLAGSYPQRPSSMAWRFDSSVVERSGVGEPQPEPAIIEDPIYWDFESDAFRYATEIRVLTTAEVVIDSSKIQFRVGNAAMPAVVIWASGEYHEGGAISYRKDDGGAQRVQLVIETSRSVREGQELTVIFDGIRVGATTFALERSVVAVDYH